VLTAIQGTMGLKIKPEEGDETYGPYEYLPVQAFLDKTSSSSELLANIKPRSCRKRLTGRWRSRA